MTSSETSNNGEVGYAFGREVIAAEMRALQGLLERLDARAFAAAVEAILGCKGRVIVSGVGKAGIIGEKISATLASTGAPSHSVHPLEAVHGDLGRILAADVVLILSNSGETEVVALLPYLRHIGAKIIAITGDAKSTLARDSDIVIDMGRIEEACPWGLAPSASTTVMLAVGDALALTVARMRHFDKENYAFFHPGGELGRRLLRVEQVMRSGGACGQVHEGVSVREALDAITRIEGRAGAISIVDEAGRLIGIFTDGDLRRHILSGASFLDCPISQAMTRNPKRAVIGSLAAEAGRVMREHRIDELPVVDAEGRLRGMLDIQDLLQTRLIRVSE